MAGLCSRHHPSLGVVEGCRLCYGSQRVCLLHNDTDLCCVACAITWKEFQVVFAAAIDEKMRVDIVYCECGFAYRATAIHCTKPGCGILLPNIKGEIEDGFRRQETES